MADGSCQKPGCFPLPNEGSTVLLLGSWLWPPAPSPLSWSFFLPVASPGLGWICANPTIPWLTCHHQWHILVSEPLKEETSQTGWEGGMCILPKAERDRKWGCGCLGWGQVLLKGESSPPFLWWPWLTCPWQKIRSFLAKVASSGLLACHIPRIKHLMDILLFLTPTL